MKNFIFAVLMTLAVAPVAYADAEKAKVCVDVKDKEGKAVKDAKGNVKQNCKEMKVHKKLDGTAVPVKK
jgi:hypothetical protein